MSSSDSHESADEALSTNTAVFPIDVRPLQAVWKSIFFTPGPYRPDPARDPRWNRGAYLAEALAGCSVCHTDRNLVGAEQIGHPYAGAVIDGWYATPLDISPSPARWSEDDFFTYLRHGESPPHGVALGPMRAVVREPRQVAGRRRAGDRHLFRQPELAPGRAAGAGPRARPHADAARDGPASRRAKRSISSTVQSCHGTPGSPPSVAKSPLGLTASLWARYRPFNLLLTVLNGIDGSDGLPGSMPGFRDKLSDQELEALVVYLRASHTTLPPWGLISDRVTRARNDPLSLP